ncbi:MAG: NAD-dependent epimerase/dehydratase family protein [Syntrophobacteraceae bacterium]
MNIVIMGASSHIAKGLIDRFLRRAQDSLFLFSRSIDRVGGFVEAIGPGNCSVHFCDDYRTFSSPSYDVVINCVGVETRNKHNCDFTRYFTLTEEFDNLALGYLRHRNPDALYVSFSSGAVYGKGFSTPAAESSVNQVRVNNLLPEDYYGIARINAEAKHRSNADLRIVDLRIFSYFSRYINLADGYFITDLLEAILNRSVLITDTADIVRDYLHPDDLFAMILKCIEVDKMNKAIDVTSLRPVSKQEILDYFTSEYSLRYEKRAFSENASATGAKSNYYSVCNRAAKIGYSPRFSSIETLKEEAGYILAGIQKKSCQ